MRPINLTDAVADLAPLTPPPCFHNSTAWREYLTSSAAAQNNRRIHLHVILRTEDGGAVFNHEFPFCKDCNAQHSLKMTAEGRCDPSYLKKPVRPELPEKSQDRHPARKGSTVKLQGPIEEIRQAIARLAPDRASAQTARVIEQHPDVVRACRSSKTRARRHIERLVHMGHVKSDGAAQMPVFWLEGQ